MSQRLSLNIRRANAEDFAYLPGIERSAAQLFHQVGLSLLADSPIMSLEDFKHVSVDGLLFVAVNNLDVPIGFAAVEALAGTAYLAELSVSSNWQRRGVGTTLLAAVLHNARALGATQTTLTTFEDFPWNAPFYLKSGFQRYQFAQPPTQLCRALAEKLTVFEDLPARVAMSSPLRQPEP
ncbi:MAG: GNAT family N-acetyltransferase [Stappiaceae bacterium]